VLLADHGSTSPPSCYGRRQPAGERGTEPVGRADHDRPWTVPGRERHGAIPPPGHPPLSLTVAPVGSTVIGQRRHNEPYLLGHHLHRTRGNISMKRSRRASRYPSRPKQFRAGGEELLSLTLYRWEPGLTSPGAHSSRPLVLLDVRSPAFEPNEWWLAREGVLAGETGGRGGRAADGRAVRREPPWPGGR